MASINLITEIPGPKSKLVLERRKKALPAGLAKSTEVVVEKAEGGIVWDADGNQLLDFAGGIGMINVGHRPETVVNAIKAQLDKYIHTCSLVTTYEPYIELAELLNSLTPGTFPKKTLLCNTGTEAVENAVMLAKYYTKRPGVICFEGAYHGRSMLTLSLTSKYSLFKKGFGSFASDIYRLPAPNMYRVPQGMTADEYLNWNISNLDHAFIAQVDPEAVAAIIIEPVLGEGGFVPMPAPFLKKIRELCDKHGIVMIADEIQSGSGRTGKLFAIEHSDVVPDIITAAKSMGAGMPISAVVGKAEIMDCTHLGGVGGTYSGSPVSAVAAIEALKILSSPEFLERATHVGGLINSTMTAWKDKYPKIGDVRGLGAMQLIEFVKDHETKEPDMQTAMDVLKDAVTHGIILIRAGLYSNCIRLLPPIVMTDEQLLEGLQVLEDAIGRVSARGVVSSPLSIVHGKNSECSTKSRDFVERMGRIQTIILKENNAIEEGEKRQHNWDELVSDLVNNCEKYHGFFYEKGTFTGPSHYFHIRALNATDKEKSEMTYAMLASWGMHRMGGGPQMNEYKIFDQSISKSLDRIQLFKEKRLEDLSEDKIDELKEVFDFLGDTMKSSVKIVAVSKILAHYLPNIIAPIDNEYTFQFINQIPRQKSQPRHWDAFDLFKSIHLNLFQKVIIDNNFKMLAERWMNDAQFIWDTSVLKIVDNLIIGKIGNLKTTDDRYKKK